jgi:hypothetical protein
MKSPRFSVVNIHHKNSNFWITLYALGMNALGERFISDNYTVGVGIQKDYKPYIQFSFNMCVDL